MEVVTDTEGVNAEDINAEEKVQYPYVVRGARIYCNCGTHIRKLDMPVSHGSHIRDKAMLHEKDCVVGLDNNIPPFGACRSEENENMKIEISDADGLLPLMDEHGGVVIPEVPVQGKLCDPQLGKKWLDAYEDTLIDGKPALTVNCTIACKYGGTIGFMDDGQEV